MTFLLYDLMHPSRVYIYCSFQHVLGGHSPRITLGWMDGTPVILDLRPTLSQMVVGRAYNIAIIVGAVGCIRGMGASTSKTSPPRPLRDKLTPRLEAVLTRCQARKA